MADPVLTLDAVSKRFGALVASDAVSLDVRSGEIHALIGPNGAGKSTLIAQVTGSLRPDSGTIRFGGRDIGMLDAPARARLGLARTFQISSLVPGFTVLENAMLGVMGASGTVFRVFRPALGQAALTEPAMAALSRVGLAGRAAARAADLSHGERRLLEVAVALTLRPRLFLMDEPMAGLGADGARALTALLDGLRTEAPILLVEHDMDAVFALADRISVLVAGRVIATGTVAEIRADAGVRAAYLGQDA